MRVITVCGYWAWAIINGEKRVENRSWNTHYRGPLAIHVCRKTKQDRASREFLESLGIACPSLEELEELRGRVLGVCELVACQRLEDYQRPLQDPDPYAFGAWCWALARPRRLAEPVAVLGRQSLWTLPRAVQESVDRQLQLPA